MTFAEILDAVRGHYVERFRLSAEERRLAAPQHTVVTEAPYLTSDGAVAREGFFSLPLRQDLILLAPDAAEAVEVTDGEAMPFAPVEFEWEGVAVTVRPFHWSACALTLPGLSAQSDWRPLAAWFAAWFDEADDHAPLADGLRGAVHRVAEPRFDSEAAHLTVDLGSAPVDGFEQLLDALALLKPRAILVGD